MAEADQPATEDPGTDTPAERPRFWRRRRCDNCGARLRGRFCVVCGQRDRQFGPIMCENCGAAKQGAFCAVCGQNDRNYRRNVFPVVAEALAETFETDSRLFRTLGVLFMRPGFLSTEFSQNRRARYLSPFRLYFFTSIAFFFVLSLSIDLPDGPPVPGERRPAFLQVGPGDAPPRAAMEEAAAGEPDGDERSASTETEDIVREGRELGSADGDEAPDEGGPSLPGLPRELTAEQQAGIERFRGILDERRQRQLRELLDRPIVGQAIAASVENIPADAYKDMGDYSRHLVGQLMDILHRPFDAARAWLENLPIAMFCLLPFYALLLKILYIRPKRFYSEHLVFAMHIHTVAYIVFTVLVLLPDVPGFGWLGPSLILALAVYYFLALKRYYGNGAFLTLVKYAILAGLYSVLLALALVGAAGAVLLFF
ncbi:MAG: DUF3667 domain-containing protein [Gammaproteobacteria bacterium]|nr:DUF3667 domain-containing protein [Gammaproteobacteria bacterium]